MILVDVDKQSQNDYFSRRSNLTSQITRGTTNYVQPSTRQRKKYPKISITNEPDQEEQIEEDYVASNFDNPKRKVSSSQQ